MKMIIFNFDQARQKIIFTSASCVLRLWRYFDYRWRMKAFAEGYQSVPVDWELQLWSEERIFGLMKGLRGIEKI